MAILVGERRDGDCAGLDSRRSKETLGGAAAAASAGVRRGVDVYVCSTAVLPAGGEDLDEEKRGLPWEAAAMPAANSPSVSSGASTSGAFSSRSARSR